jgi:hypothetical protein
MSNVLALCPQSRVDEARDELCDLAARLHADPRRLDDPMFMRAFDNSNKRYAQLRGMQERAR